MLIFEYIIKYIYRLVPVVSASEICGLNKDSSLWLERGWRTRDTTPSRLDDKECQTKLLQGSLGMLYYQKTVSIRWKKLQSVKFVGLQHPTADGNNSEYAEVNLSTFYQGNNPQGNVNSKTAPPEPYATTALCVPNQGPRSLVSFFFCLYYVSNLQFCSFSLPHHIILTPVSRHVTFFSNRNLWIQTIHA